jgi:D-proline reductase (dithiol) PrdB
MVRLDDLHPEEAAMLRRRKIPPIFENESWLPGVRLKDAKIALITSSGIHRRDDVAFRPGEQGFRLIPADVDFADMTQSHVSANFDRSAYQQDPNIVFPLERLREMAAAGEIGAVADWHYSIMGAQPDIPSLEPIGLEIGRLMKEEGVDAALLVPV